MARDSNVLELEALQREFPLPGGFRLGEPLFDTASVPGLRLNLVGLLARHEDGREALGSAGAAGEEPLARAYFELFERICVLEQLAHPSQRYAACRADGGRESLTFAEVFPQAPDGAAFQYSRSNGVAAARTWERACAGAAAELVERDRLLRAWFGETQPERCSTPENGALSALAPFYEFETYSFPSRVQRDGELAVAALFGFPKSSEAPLVFGSAAAGSHSLALEGALRECLQRWGFLWGERIPSEAPSFSPTADYHQEFFLWPSQHATLRAFLAGAHSSLDCLGPHPGPARTSCRFVDLSPGPGIRVVRAVPGRGGELPLTFGRGHPSARSALPESLCVHPLA